MLKKDSLRLGIVLGFLAPVAGFFIYYLIQFSTFTFNEYLRVILQQKSLLSGVISLCLIANAIVFTIYINTRKDRTARGIFISTCIYGVISLLLKFFA